MPPTFLSARRRPPPLCPLPPSRRLAMLAWLLLAGEIGPLSFLDRSAALLAWQMMTYRVGRMYYGTAIIRNRFGNFSHQ